MDSARTRVHWADELGQSLTRVREFDDSATFAPALVPSLFAVTAAVPIPSASASVPLTFSWSWVIIATLLIIGILMILLQNRRRTNAISRS
jgi:hypothetical protein